MLYTIEDIVPLIGAQWVGNVNCQIDWLLTDSRSLSFPEETLFFALKSRRDDGHKYVPELYDRGVRNFVVSELPKNKDDFQATNFLCVNSPLKALQKLAEKHRGKFQIPIIGITGSNGKTIVKEWLYHLLSPERVITRSPRSYNSQIGVPLSVWLMDENTELGIFEAGISEMGEMQALEDIIRPSIGVFTNIGGAHQENFFSMQEKCMEKLTLFKDCDILIYNGDEELLSNCVARSILTTRELAWSRVDYEKPLFIRSVEKEECWSTIKYRYLGLDNEFRIPFVDEASIENALHCLAVCLYLMVSPENIAARMEKLEPIAMRMELKEGKNNCVLINDTYNSDLASLEIALDFLDRRARGKNLKRTLILSDLLESGQNPHLLYRKVAQYCYSKGIEKLIAIGPDISAYGSKFDLEKHFFKNTKSFLRSSLISSLHNEIILIKGARQFQFEDITEYLELKVHETVLEINLNALVDNLNYYRSKLQSETRMICMVKASAYGAGSYEIAKTLQDHKVEYLAVAVADEGAELRKSGIIGSILIMNPEISAFKTMFEYKLEPEIYSFYLLDALIKEAEKEGITNYPVHIKIDTGMHRLGFSLEDIPTIIRKLKMQTALIPRSVFSHLAASSNEEFDKFTHTQIDLLNVAYEKLQAAFPHRLLRHICNSAGIERFPEAHFDMVRLGIGLYGINPLGNSMLQNVNTLKSTILEIKSVPKGETVGYNRAAILEKDSRIAIIPIGYADGLDRHLGNGRAYCLVNGKKAPYIGNICMDVCMIDITDIECQEGDHVIIFGDELPITVLSDTLDTIPYEVLTGVSSRVKRIYYQD